MDAFEAERAVALASLASMHDDMYRWPMRLAQEAAWAGHPYGMSLLGTEETLRRMSPADLAAFQVYYHVPATTPVFGPYTGSLDNSGETLTLKAGSGGAALREAVDESFNRISVDGDTSTNDTVLCLANGLAKNATIQSGTTHYRQFEELLTQASQALALAICRDGEGVTKVVKIAV